LLSSKSAGEYLGISSTSIRKLVADGKLPAYLIGAKKLVRFDPADLDKYLAANRVGKS
jgi:excisionase family DNA binding protein